MSFKFNGFKGLKSVRLSDISREVSLEELDTIRKDPVACRPQSDEPCMLRAGSPGFSIRGSGRYEICKSDLTWIGSQCREAKIGVIWSKFLALIKILATAYHLNSLSTSRPHKTLNLQDLMKQ